MEINSFILGCLTSGGVETVLNLIKKLIIEE